MLSHYSTSLSGSSVSVAKHRFAPSGTVDFESIRPRAPLHRSATVLPLQTHQYTNCRDLARLSHSRGPPPLSRSSSSSLSSLNDYSTTPSSLTPSPIEGVSFAGGLPHPTFLHRPNFRSAQTQRSPLRARTLPEPTLSRTYSDVTDQSHVFNNRPTLAHKISAQIGEILYDLNPTSVALRGEFDQALQNLTDGAIQIALALAELKNCASAAEGTNSVMKFVVTGFGSLLERFLTRVFQINDFIEQTIVLAQSVNASCDEYRFRLLTLSETIGKTEEGLRRVHSSFIQWSNAFHDEMEALIARILAQCASPAEYERIQSAAKCLQDGKFRVHENGLTALFELFNQMSSKGAMFTPAIHFRPTKFIQQHYWKRGDEDAAVIVKWATIQANLRESSQNLIEAGQLLMRG